MLAFNPFGISPGQETLSLKPARKVAVCKGLLESSQFGWGALLLRGMPAETPGPLSATSARKGVVRGGGSNLSPNT